MKQEKLPVCSGKATCLVNQESWIRSWDSPVLQMRYSSEVRDKLLTRSYCGEAGDYAVPNVLYPRDLVFGPDLRTKIFRHIKQATEKHDMTILYYINKAHMYSNTKQEKSFTKTNTIDFHLFKFIFQC